MPTGNCALFLIFPAQDIVKSVSEGAHKAAQIQREMASSDIFITALTGFARLAQKLPVRSMTKFMAPAFEAAALYQTDLRVDQATAITQDKTRALKQMEEPCNLKTP